RVDFPLAGEGQDAAAVRALETLRTQVIPPVLATLPAGTQQAVTGDTAANVDFNKTMKSRAPIVFAFVLGFAFLLLLLTFRSTASTVTSAAAVMIAVFAIFASLRTLDIKQLGVGLAVAVLLDATLIRGVLLPAAMKLLGDWNWYLPRWLEWMPRIGAESKPREDIPTTPPIPVD